MINFKNIFLIAFLSFALTSCDKVKNPIQNPTSTNTGNPSTPTNTSTPMQQVRKVLIEDYSGHKCGNCPPAVVALKNIYKDYPTQVVPIVIHAGFFAKVDASGTYTTDYKTSVGTDWNSASGFGIENAGYPNGMVNRKDFGSGLILKETSWAATYSLAKADPYILGLTISKTYDEVTKVLNTSIKAKFKVAYANNVKLNVILTEDSLVSPQKDYALPSGQQDVLNYTHMFMLRAGLNGTWGQTLKATPIVANDSVSVNIPSYTLDNKFVPKHISIVAFAYDETTREVLQVEKIKLK